ncbi:uncharacterized protein PV07_06458 [Cladophialophora immunda]|uniref:BRCT domain-containing protein n=1 Tax=Cladophialophora immunda TaxID=569365 RepID=A0A0D2CSQ6_9EURO|nr:uncharacterized protein PV07_06458 [Cladophialophora immunda]KIW26639.1 hypothetical protein PV07_06458 [Cladophialophora immunda]OQV01890.1 hypothetical protein CLAIMM_07180 [Cladophialophora immunda]
MPAHHPKQPPAPQPTRVFFDPFNSSSTGHQRAENRLSGSTSWRESRTYKLSHQFRDATGRGGSQHLADLVGAGSQTFGPDGHKANGDGQERSQRLRGKGWQDIRDMMSGPKRRPNLNDNNVEETEESAEKRPKASHDGPQHRHQDETSPFLSGRRRGDDPIDNSSTTSPTTILKPSPPQIFRNLTMCLNGSSFPLISDHRLKHLFAQHGGHTSIVLGRRTVTHVVLGSNSAGGGGLAGGKIQKEVHLVRGKGVKYVTAQWVVDSVAQGVRQPESKYIPDGVGGRIGGSGQVSVRQMFQPKR